MFNFLISVLKWTLGTVLATMVVMIILAGVSEAKADTGKCVAEAYLKGYGWSGTYGGAIMGVGTAVGLALSPTPVGWGVGIAVVGLNTLTGGALGVGSSAVTRLSDEKFFGFNPTTLACVEKTAAGVGGKIKEFFTKDIPRGAKNTWNSPMPAWKGAPQKA